MTGIKDVAKELKMSTATVSRALRGLPGVSDTTRERVQQTAQALGYVPSPSAAGLASGQTWTVKNTDNGTTVLQRTATTLAPSGSFSVAVRSTNRPGADSFVATATNAVSDFTLAVSAALSTT